MSELWRRLVRDPGPKAVAVLLALVAWFWVQSQETDTGRVRVQLAWELPDGLVPVAPLLTSATVEVVGPRAAIRRAQRDRPTLIVDLASEGLGTHELHLDTYDLVGMPAGLTHRDWRPDVLTVRLDKEVTRNVRVVAAWVGDPADAHAVQGVSVVPDVAQLAGPRSVIDALHEIRTMPIDVSGWAENRSVPVALDLPRTVRTVEGWTGAASVVVTSVESTLALDRVPVVFEQSGWQTAAGQETIAVVLRGPTSVLGSMPTDRVLALVELPAEPGERHYAAAFQGSAAPRYTIIYPRPDKVEVKSAPPRIEVERR